MAQWSPYNRPRRDAVCNPEILQKGFELGAATVHGLPFESDRALNDKTEIHLIGQHTKPLSREALTKVRASFFDTEDIRITFKDPHSLKIICIEVPFEERIKNLLKIVYRLTDLMIGTELFFRGFLLIFHGMKFLELYHSTEEKSKSYAQMRNIAELYSSQTCKFSQMAVRRALGLYTSRRQS